jgi:Flp pilus assembly protein TadB
VRAHYKKNIASVSASALLLGHCRGGPCRWDRGSVSRRWAAPRARRRRAGNRTNSRGFPCIFAVGISLVLVLVFIILVCIFFMVIILVFFMIIIIVVLVIFVFILLEAAVLSRPRTHRDVLI